MQYECDKIFINFNVYSIEMHGYMTWCDKKIPVHIYISRHILTIFVSFDIARIEMWND